MKKTVAVMLAVLMILTLVTLVSCKIGGEATKVRVTLFVTDTNVVVRNHVVGQNDLPTDFTNGDLVFGGWYYDTDFNEKFNPDSKENNQVLYAKWNDASIGNTDTVTLTLNPNYAGSQTSSFVLTKNSPFASLPATFERSGYKFEGWFTQSVGGFRWTNEMPVSVDTVLYAHWTNVGQGGGDDTPTPIELQAVLDKYADTSNWNFADTVTITDSKGAYDDYYEYLGDLVLNRYEDVDGNMCVDYYDMSDYEVWYYYGADANGNYSKYDDTSDEFGDAYSYSAIIDLYNINTYAFTADGDRYAAAKPSDAGNAVLGEFDGLSWTSVYIYIANGNIARIVGEMSDGTVYNHVFSKFGAVSFTLPNVGSGGNDTPTPNPSGTMENQVYDANTFDSENLQDKMLKNDEAIGLPSKGEYNALVIPVQFKNDNITDAQLAKLDKAFNGTSTDTGWESVKSYYEKSSYGQLKLTFDIQSVFQASNNASYYERYSQTVGSGDNEWTKDGSALILEEALSWCVRQGVDLSKYDTNADGCIDAVYLIYSASVDYDSNDSFYWAYVTWYYGEDTYGGKDAYFYLFAGFDFMDEKLEETAGLKINAETYIHETGHLLGLDDYYDYNENKGSNQGLGGADMMDYNVGDHGVYSKIMLGWITPEIVTSTKTVTIKSSQEGGYAILVPLNFDNSYFCEYLLIDLYTATGLNEMDASKDDTILYGGAQYGVRIYHVSSSIKNPYADDGYGSFTDNNNSVTKLPLIKLVEADGRTSSSSSNWASASDLWQTGDSLKEAFPNYTRYDNKLLNFNVTIDSVTAQQAVVSVTYNVA